MEEELSGNILYVFHNDEELARQYNVFRSLMEKYYEDDIELTDEEDLLFSEADEYVDTRLKELISSQMCISYEIDPKDITKNVPDMHLMVDFYENNTLPVTDFFATVDKHISEKMAKAEILQFFEKDKCLHYKYVTMWNEY